ncbi:hypothetical protein FHY55_11935 [Oceanicola sp. D3]|uniref:gamma-glutamyl-gamma-aminobutyrate hydrolase family protein n=1 Tax=Oceanicola sp. D3 TaxID=2587163 RepID=UPI00111E0332|nr:gamma-glutamyl-gamma-aminobutyrate hydrolase family protein [Oceanicola sp. D3]QDC09910.1 hypothetical protein FHY55_11935 [Oceanicola sp. D3]
MPGNINIGVTWRRDGRNAAHRGDLAVFDHIALRRDIETFTLAWDEADTADDVRLGELANMHLLVVPGGPHANDTQIPTVKTNGRGRPVTQAKDNVAKGNAAAYASQRAQSELDLIEKARVLGMPILALCGGSWRLVENYGGSTIELAALGRDGKIMQAGASSGNRTRHAGPMNRVETQFKHPLETRPGSLLEDATGRTKARADLKPGQKLPEMHANSVHWAAVRTRSMGTRPDLQEQPYEVAPNNMLNMSARDPSALKTSEAVESAHGAPVIGAQWHPEYQLPTGADDEEHPTSRAANLRLIQYMIEAASAYKVHRETVELLIKRHKRKTPIGNASAVRWRGAPVHTSATPGRPARPASIPRHKEDTENPAWKSRSELLVRAYLYNLGRKENLYLTPDEMLNLALGAPLPAFRLKQLRHGAPIAAFLEKNVWAGKYLKAEDKRTVLNTWPRDAPEEGPEEL